MMKGSTTLADIDGGPIVNNHQSIFSHIERGLLKSPNELAIISMHQPADHLAEWLGPDRELQFLIKSSDATKNCLVLTYAQLHAGALRLAAGLTAQGILPGSRVLCVISNGVEYALILWTCAVLRLTLAALDLSILSNKEVLVTHLESLQPDVIFVDDIQGATYIEAALTQIPSTPPSSLGVLLNHQEGHTLQRWVTFRHLLEVSPSTTDNFDAAVILNDARNDDPERIYSILFTSGTSAWRPKGCPLRVGSMTHILESQSWLITETNCSRVLQQAHNSRAIGPQHTLQTWREGGAVVMSTGPSFAVAHTLEALEHHGATFIVLSPAMVHALENELPRLLKGSRDSVQTVQVGGDATTREVLARCAKLFPRARVCVNHGMSEGGGFFTWPFFDRSVEDLPYLAEFCPLGAVASGARIRIWNSDKGEIAPRQQPGQLHVSCDSLIRGYLGGVNASSFFTDSSGSRWMDTGDVATVSSDGLVYILGRSKDTILRMGRAIMPAVLESCIERYVGAQVSALCYIISKMHCFSQVPCSRPVSWQSRIPFLATNHLRC